MPNAVDLFSRQTEALDPWRVSDNALARAYVRTADWERAQVKTAIAGLYAALEPGRPLEAAATARFASGLARRVERRPRPWHVVVLDPDNASAPQVAAAVLPAIVRRVPGLAVVRPRSRTAWPAPVLTALELAGVEGVYCPPQKVFNAFLHSLAGDDSGCVACLGRDPLWSRVLAAFGPRAFRLTAPERVGVWADGVQWDARAIRFCHPGAAVQVWGGEPIPGFEHCPGDFEAFCRQGYHAVYAPASTCPPSARLCLEPGRESLWEWVQVPAGLYEASSVRYLRD